MNWWRYRVPWAASRPPRFDSEDRKAPSVSAISMAATTTTSNSLEVSAKGGQPREGCSRKRGRANSRRERRSTKTEDIANKNGDAREAEFSGGDRGAYFTQHLGIDIPVRMKLTRERRGQGKQQIRKTMT